MQPSVVDIDMGIDQLLLDPFMRTDDMGAYGLWCRVWMPVMDLKRVWDCGECYGENIWGHHYDKNFCSYIKRRSKGFAVGRRTDGWRWSARESFISPLWDLLAQQWSEYDKRNGIWYQLDKEYIVDVMIGWRICAYRVCHRIASDTYHEDSILIPNK